MCVAWQSSLSSQMRNVLSDRYGVFQESSRNFQPQNISGLSSFQKLNWCDLGEMGVEPTLRALLRIGISAS